MNEKYEIIVEVKNNMGEINSKTKYYIQNENGEWVEITEEQLKEEQANYEAWQLLSELLEQAGLKLVPSERTARKIADMERCGE